MEIKEVLPWPNLTFGEMSLNAQIIVGFYFIGYEEEAIPKFISTNF